MSLENVLIRVTKLGEAEFKKMQFQRYATIGSYHAIYSKGQSLYLFRIRETEHEKLYYVLEVYDKPEQSTQEVLFV